MANRSWAMAFGTWEDTQSWVDRDVPFAGPDPVSRGDIRRRLEVLAWDCPLHYDEAVAAEHGHPAVPAPATMLMTWAMPAYWSPGEERPTLDTPAAVPRYPHSEIPAPGSAMFATRNSVEFHEPVYPGDVISGTTKLTKLTPKRLAVGDGAFMEVETTYVKQTGAMVGIQRLTLFRFEPSSADEGAVSA